MIDAIFIAVVIFAFGLVILRLYDVQVRQGEAFSKRSHENFIQIKRLGHDRGEIVDREGRVLVTNRASFNVYVTPAFFPPTATMLRRLGAVSGLPKAQVDEVLVALLRAAEERGPPILFATHLGPAAAQGLREVQAALEIPNEALLLMEVQGEEGTELAAYLDPAHFPTRERVYLRLRELLSLSDQGYQRVKQTVSRVVGLARYRDILIRPDIPPEAYAALQAEIELGDLPGVSLRGAKARDYRHGRVAAHLLGYINELSPEELEEKKELGYRMGDLMGRRGVEQTYEEDLRGIDGHETVVVDSKGRGQDSDLADQLRGEVGDHQEPRAGNRVVLSLDIDLQKAAEQAFPGRAGAVVVMDVNSGRLLAVTSTPTFDPNLVSGYFQRGERQRLAGLKDLRPWRFRAIQDHFAPGSTFKAITLLAGLREKVVGPRESVFCPGAYTLGGIRFRCWKDAGHGAIDAVTSLERSCDVYYYTLGARLGLEPIADMASGLGYGRATGIPIAGESSGIMPTVAWHKKRFGFYSLGSAVNASIGQGAVAATLIQLAVSYAAIANGGTVFEPQVALRVEAFDGSAVREFPPVVARKLELPEEHLELVRRGLFNVVNLGSGTAYRRRLKDLAVSGKTGTAQVAKMGAKRIKKEQLPWELRDHAWFVAYAPSDAPEIVVAVLNEHGGGGSSDAAPTAMAVIQAWHDKRVRTSAARPSSLSIAELAASDVHEHEAQEEPPPWPVAF